MLKPAMILVILGMAVALPALGQTASPGSAPSASAHPAPLAPSQAPSPPHATAPAPAQTTAPAPAASPAPQRAAANQFPDEAAAKAHCPGDTIVWINLGGSKAYHTKGDRFYGKTRRGAYMCQKDAEAAGYHVPGHRPSRAAAKSTNAKTPQ